MLFGYAPFSNRLKSTWGMTLPTTRPLTHGMEVLWTVDRLTAGLHARGMKIQTLVTIIIHKKTIEQYFLLNQGLFLTSNIPDIYNGYSAG
jgi:hypothetical protein